MSKTLECKLCGTFVRHCSDRAGKVTCWLCVAKAVGPPPEPVRKKTGFPPGWKFKKVFVHADGTVYYKGVEQPDLKGTQEPTVIEVKQKKSKAEREQERHDALIQIGQLKKQLKAETRKGAQRKLQSQIKKLQKQL